MLKDRLQDDLKAAMRARDDARLRTVRALRAALLEREIELRPSGVSALTEEQETEVVLKQAKQRRDALEQYRGAGREDLASKEEEELRVLDDYLPAQMTNEQIEAIIREIVETTGAESMRDMGKVMGPAMGRLKGQADGKRVQAVVRSILGG